MRKIALLIFLLNNLFAIGQTYQERTVLNFHENLRKWFATNDIDYRLYAEKSCDKGCRVDDKIMIDFARSSNVQIKNYVVSSYMNGFQTSLDRGKLYLQVNNVRTLGANEISLVNSKKFSKYADGITAIVGHVVLTGIINYDIENLFLVKDQKIVKISTCEFSIDKTTGKRKVKVDLSDIDFDDETIGITYNYGQHFKVGASISYAIPWFLVSVDFGLANKMDPVTSTKVELTDIMNYKITTTSLKPKMFMTVTPALNLKYVAVGCGVGILYMEGSEDTKNSYYLSYTDGSVYGNSTSNSDITSLKFMLRPSIKGFIPLSDEWSLVVGTGYDYAFKYKKCNGFNFSLGFQYSLD